MELHFPDPKQRITLAQDPEPAECPFGGGVCVRVKESVRPCGEGCVCVTKHPENLSGHTLPIVMQISPRENKEEASYNTPHSGSAPQGLWK